jgi:hypothetical protein
VPIKKVKAPYVDIVTDFNCHLTRRQDSSVVQRWATGWMIRGSCPTRGVGIYLFTTAPRPALGPTQPSIQWVPGALSLGVKWLGREADHSPPCSAEITNALSYTSTPKYAFMVWCSIKKQRANFTFTCYFIPRTYLTVMYTSRVLCHIATQLPMRLLNCTNVPTWVICFNFKRKFTKRSNRTDANLSRQI